MSVSVPTSVQFKQRYPAFNAVDDALIDAVIADAAREVSEDWIAADQTPAILAFAAHLLALEGVGGRSVSLGGSDVNVSGAVEMTKVGDVSVKFLDTSKTLYTPTKGGLDETPYGRRFLELRRRSFPAVMVV